MLSKFASMILANIFYHSEITFKEKERDTRLFHSGIVLNKVYDSCVKWSVLAHLKSQPSGQNFQAQKLVERSSPHYSRTNKNTKNTFKIN